MSDDNRVSAKLSDQDLPDILGAVATIRAKLQFLVTLSPQERREMAILWLQRLRAPNQ